MAEYKTILVEREGRLARLWLNRPDVHNAFNIAMIRELRSAVRELRDDASVRVVVLSGKGKSFCAGADLNWMREVIRYSYEQNLQEALELADFHYELYSLPKPTIARVNGAAVGGGTGLISACDIGIASSDAKLGLSEVKLGLVPAVISPYVVRKIGESHARRYFLTGERIDAAHAMQIGMVSMVAAPEELDAKVEEVVSQLLTSGPEALASAKQLLQRVPTMNFEEARTFTSEMIAMLRLSGEGQEGMSAFLEKRKTKWSE